MKGLDNVRAEFSLTSTSIATSLSCVAAFLTLWASVTSHRNHIEHAPCVLRQASELACGVRVAARGKYAPSVSQVLTGKFEAEPTIGSCDEDCCCHRMLSVLLNALLPHGFAEPRRFRKIACSYSAQV